MADVPDTTRERETPADSKAEVAPGEGKKESILITEAEMDGMTIQELEELIRIGNNKSAENQKTLNGLLDNFTDEGAKALEEAMDTWIRVGEEIVGIKDMLTHLQASAELISQERPNDILHKLAKDGYAEAFNCLTPKEGKSLTKREKEVYLPHLERLKRCCEKPLLTNREVEIKRRQEALEAAADKILASAGAEKKKVWEDDVAGYMSFIPEWKLRHGTLPQPADWYKQCAMKEATGKAEPASSS